MDRAEMVRNAVVYLLSVFVFLFSAGTLDNYYTGVSISKIIFVILICLSSYYFFALKISELKISPTLSFKALSIIIIWAGVSLMVTETFSSGYFVLYSLAGYLILDQLITKLELKESEIFLVLKWLVVGGIFCSIIGFFQFYTGAALLDSLNREALYKSGPFFVVLGPELNPNAFSAILISPFVISSGLFLSSKRWERNVIFGFASSVMLIAMYMSLSRAGLLAIIISIFTMSFLFIYKKLSTKLHVIKLLLVLTAVTGCWYGTDGGRSIFVITDNFVASDVESKASMKDKISSIEVRKFVFIQNLKTWVGNPIFGVGYNNARKGTIGVPILKHGDTVGPHNTIMGLGTEFGSLVAIIFVWLSCRIIFKFIGEVRIRPVTSYSVLFFSLFLGFSFYSLFHLTYMNVGYWFVLFFADNLIDRRDLG